MNALMKYLGLAVLGATLLAASGCMNAPKDKTGTEDANAASDQGSVTSGVGNDDAASTDGFPAGGSNLVPGDNQRYFFEFNSNEVHSKDLPSIKVQGKYLASHPAAHVRLEGNTDERGSREYNLGLGERRAKSVAEVLKLAGANTKQISVVSYGAERPLASGHDESAWQQNRRVELIYENK
jgi:peptidoglycan-associated lipoprotein